MGLRQDLNDLFETLCENVYFQPPANVLMAYPAIVYQRDAGDVAYADDIPYRATTQYQVTCISRNPDDGLTDKVTLIPLCKHVRFFAIDGLNHDVFTLFF